MAKGNGRISVGIFDHTGDSLGGAQLVAAHFAAVLSRSCAVELIRDWKEYGLEKAASAFCLDLSGVKQRNFEIPSFPSDGFGIPGGHSFREQMRRSRRLTQPYDVFIYCGHGIPPFCYARQGFLYCHFPFHPSPRIALRTSRPWLCRNRLDRLVRGVGYQLLWQIRMRGYKTVLANSLFTARSVESQWGRRAEVLYPPVDLKVPEIEKQNLIVSVGRFSPGSLTAGKQQLEQIGAFRKFLTKVGGRWGMYLIGSCYTAGEKAYLAAVQRAAEGLPATFLVNVDREAVCRALGESKIFWHTQGLGNEETEKPYKAEHFGIATVEAMRAGCVPIVIASGGQKEIIQNASNGFLCDSLDQLVRNTVAVADDPRAFRTLSQRARQRSMAFTIEEFEQRVKHIVLRDIPSIRMPTLGD
jgi:L-malate glycosyltransferase